MLQSGVHLVTVYHSDGMGHGTLWDMSHCPIASHGTLGRDGHLGLIMGLFGTSQVIPSHPMGLIGIASTVPGTFGIPNVPMDIVGNAEHVGPSYLQGLNLHIYTYFTQDSLFMMEFRYNFTYKFYQLNLSHFHELNDYMQACRLAGYTYSASPLKSHYH